MKNWIKRILCSFVAVNISVFTSSSITTNAAVTDPDGDGVITVNDAVYIGQYLSGRICPTDIARLDFDGNGIVSEMDLRTVILYLAEIWRD